MINKVNKIQDSFLAESELIILGIICRCTPSFITSNMLTSVGVVGAAIAFCGFWLAHESVAWLWLVIVGLALNWFGDSLDGALARHRKMERHAFGFFVDHASDALSVALIMGGVAVSPFVGLVTGLLLLVAYYLLMILSLIICHATGNFPISYNRVGPTEMRLVLALCVVAIIMLPVPSFAWIDMKFTIYDIVFVSLTGLMVLSAVVRAIQTGRYLTIVDPCPCHPRTSANRSSTPLQ